MTTKLELLKTHYSEFFKWVGCGNPLTHVEVKSALTYGDLTVERITSALEATFLKAYDRELLDEYIDRELDIANSFGLMFTNAAKKGGDKFPISKERVKEIAAWRPTEQQIVCIKRHARKACLILRLQPKK